ncbi:hypothetical protein PENTCL1PPCAC_26603, partial [Pristionchus entomophagus]
ILSVVPDMMARLALIIVVLSAPLVASTMGELSQELLSEGLVTLDANGTPTTTCMQTQMDGSTSITSCPQSKGFGPMGVGCFTVWNGAGLLQQGCYSSQEVALRAQCQRRACHSHRKTKGVNFCCCHGDLCNANFKAA